MRILEKNTLIITMTAFMLSLYGCGFGKKSAKFKGGGKSQAGESQNGVNDLVIDEQGVKEAAENESENATAADSSINEDDLIREAQVDVGVKNYLQINATFSALTGVPTTEDSIISAYDSVKDQLPSGNSIKSFSASVQVGVTKLAVAYCDVLSQDATLRAEKIPGFDFDADMSAAFGTTGADSLIRGLTESFWRNLESGPELEASVGMLKSLLTELQVGANANETRNIAVGMCTSVLASSATTIF